MYKKVVVPLDGSKLAECVLPHIESIAKGLGTEEVVLVTVTERVAGLMPKEESICRLQAKYGAIPIPDYHRAAI